MTRRILRPQPAPMLLGVVGWYGTGSDNAKHYASEEHFRKGVLQDFGPYRVGERRWVREEWRVGAWDENYGLVAVDYRADNYARREWLSCPDDEMFERLWFQSTTDCKKAGVKPDDEGQYHWEPGQGPTRWRRSFFMPRWASRLTIEITEALPPQRVQEISEADAIAEGVQPGFFDGGCYEPSDDPDAPFLPSFHYEWDEINAKRGHGWDVNEWVWPFRFKRVT